MKVAVDTFVGNALVIYEQNPTYEYGHDGSDGKCDCIGLVKGALRMAGCNPSGLSGTNYASRYTIEGFSKIASTGQLKYGYVVLKGRPPGSDGYDLPDKYKPGGSSYNGDLTDYYHIGIVIQESPLKILHMTSPNAKIDTQLGKWGYVGTLPQVAYGSQPEPSPSPEPTPEPEPGGDPVKATVYAENGKPVNLRKSPSKSAALVEQVPVGSEVTVNMEGDEWCLITWKNYTGYMMTQFLLFEDEGSDEGQDEGIPEGDDDEDMIYVSRKDLQEIYDKLDFMLHG